MSKFNDLISSDKPVLVDFFAVWCGPCTTMSQILAQTKERMGGKITIIKVDIDKNPGAANAFGVHSVPTLILFKNGNQIWRQSGVLTANELEKMISQQTQSG